MKKVLKVIGKVVLYVTVTASVIVGILAGIGLIEFGFRYLFGI